MILSNEDKAGKFDEIFIAYMGGEQIVHMVTLYHVDGWSYRQIAENFGESETSVRRWIAAARRKLRTHGLMNPAWEFGAATPV